MNGRPCRCGYCGYTRVQSQPTPHISFLDFLKTSARGNCTRMYPLYPQDMKPGQPQDTTG